MGPGYDNKSQVAVRFSVTGTLGTSSPRLRIDNVSLTGTTAATVTPPQLTATLIPSSSQFQLSFTNASGIAFTVLTATNLSLPASNWSVLGSPVEVSIGYYQFTNALVTSNTAQFFRVRQP